MDILIYAVMGLCLAIVLFSILFIFVSMINKSYKKYKKHLQEYKIKHIKELMKADTEAEDD